MDHSEATRPSDIPAEHPLKEAHLTDPAEDDSSDEEFVYPAAETEGNEETANNDGHAPIAELEHKPPRIAISPLEELAPAVSDIAIPDGPPLSAISQTQPTPAQLEALYAAASSGNIDRLKVLFAEAREDSGIEPFALANDASSRTGLTVLHAAASRGFRNIVKWLIENCGAIPGMEDKEGETALHKAALNGHLDVIKYLLPNHADVHARDADGWTALHNACSKGYLDIVRWLCEHGGAVNEVNGVPGVDIRSKGGWTLLMNAASKGHLPVVLYLLSKQNADPLVRNNWGETAFDIAAAVFEIWICEVLQKAEAERWRHTTVPYNPLCVHTTVPLIIYEHQRLDTRLKTLAINGGRAKFGTSGLGRSGRPAPWELRLPKTDEETGKKAVSAWRSSVQLPFLDNPWDLPRPSTPDAPAPEGAERSHFWLSDWTLDVTHPGVDAEEGWQFAKSFADSDEQWTPHPSVQLERLLLGSGTMSLGLASPVARTSSRSSGGASGSGSSSATSQKSYSWVRRRRWVRVMRRRLDIAPLPFAQPDGGMYTLAGDGVLVPVEGNARNSLSGEDGQEMGVMRATPLSSAQDYVARARYLAGTPHPDVDADGTLSIIDARRAIAKLERATSELRQGILSDQEPERKTQGEVLLNAYSRELERRRLAAGAQGLLHVSGEGDAFADEDDSDEEFHYPGAPSTDETPRPSTLRVETSDYFSRSTSASARTPADLTPQLAQSPEFRVPTHEAPQKVLTPRWSAPTPHTMHAVWERDEHVSACRECGRRFNFINRRHCRRCGRIFCDRCSSYRALLDPSDVVSDPALPEPHGSASSHRVCIGCHEQVTAAVPAVIQGGRNTAIERIVVDTNRLSAPPSRRGSSSQISDLAECPVCNQDLGAVSNAEEHVRNCLDGGAGPTSQSAKYLVYKLPPESVLVGTECVICLEEFVKDSMVARLSCLCSFHNTCLSSWLQRGRSCPVHAR